MTTTRDINYEEICIIMGPADFIPYGRWTIMWYNRCISQMNRVFSNDIELSHAASNFKLYYDMYVSMHKREYGDLVKLSPKHLFCWKCEEDVQHC